MPRGKKVYSHGEKSAGAPARSEKKKMSITHWLARVGLAGVERTSGVVSGLDEEEKVVVRSDFSEDELDDGEDLLTMFHALAARVCAVRVRRENGSETPRKD